MNYRCLTPGDEKSPLPQQCPVRKLHAVVLPPPQPSPPETGGEGVGDVAEFSNHKALNRVHFFPLPHWGEGQGEREVISSEQKKPSVKLCTFGLSITSILTLQKPNRTLLPIPPFCQGGNKAPGR